MCPCHMLISIVSPAAPRDRAQRAPPAARPARGESLEHDALTLVVGLDEVVRPRDHLV